MKISLMLNTTKRTRTSWKKRICKCLLLIFRSVAVPKDNEKQHLEELRFLQDDYEKRIAEMAKQSKEDKQMYESRIKELERQLHAKTIERKEEKDQKKKELMEIN